MLLTRLHFLLIVGATFQPTNAGDFALVADLDNGTIYAGTFGQRLTDFAPLPLSGLVRPVAVDYDPVEKMIYWTDLRSLPSAKISRAHLDGSNQITVVDDLRLPNGLALDVESRIMFWTDGTLGHIVRASMDGTGDKEIILDNLDQPRTIVTDHGRGHIYWTDWGTSPRIERANFDGTNRRTIIEGDLFWPNGIAIHLDETKLYWCDAYYDKIERSDLAGSNREVVVNLTMHSVLHPFDLAVYKDDVYWTDWATNSVLRVHLSGRGEGNFGSETFQKAAGIHIQEEPNFCGSSPCNNGATCVDVINGFSCLCPPGFQGITCSVDPCSGGPCVNGGTCAAAPDGFTCQCPAGYEEPTCEVVAGCLFTPDPSDVVVVVSDQQAVYRPGESVEYDCPDGYQLSGSAKRICRSDFTWSGQPAECILEPISAPDPCSDNPCLNRGICTNAPDGFTCMCPAGYEAPTCALTLGGCVLTPDPSDVVAVVSNQQIVYRPGDTVEYDCPDGYQLSGSVKRICQSELTWSGQPAECIPEVKTNQNKGKRSRGVPVVVIAAGAGGAFLFIIVFTVAVVAIRKRRTRSYRDGLVPITGMASSTSKGVFMGDSTPYAKYESHIEPMYHESIF